MRFVDEAEITVRSGRGGNGCVSFRREKFVPRGGPDGGDGGKGGDVIFVCDDKLFTLYDFRHKRVFEAENGRPGMGRQRSGSKGEDMVIRVPVGTILYDVSREEPEMLVDLKSPGQTFTAARGGSGGKGNLHFKSSTMRAPRFAQPGQEGQEMRIRLELKIIAQAGLVGLPNAGKSTLLARITAARPRIGTYPFTTLSPNLGVLADDTGRQLIMADIPGLIEGAHAGHGLGHQFLRHVERTCFLVHILSVEDADPENPGQGFDLINRELMKFSSLLSQKEQILVLNKIDLVNAQKLDIIAQGFKKMNLDVFFISALDGTGVDELVQAVWKKFYQYF